MLLGLLPEQGVPLHHACWPARVALRPPCAADPSHRATPFSQNSTLLPLAGEDPTLISKSQIFARIVAALGGRAAEEVVFGEPEVTTGASGDLQQVCAGWQG